MKYDRLAYKFSLSISRHNHCHCNRLLRHHYFNDQHFAYLITFHRHYNLIPFLHPYQNHSSFTITGKVLTLTLQSSNECGNR